MKQILICCGVLICSYTKAQHTIDKQASVTHVNFKPLFNGKNLNDWYSFLRTKGKNNDPEKVFNIDSGLLHISGKEFGYIATKKAYKNFHLVAEFKWGTKKYPPRDADTIKRDNGICYYFPLNEKDYVNERNSVWPKSIECQIQEGDTGDMWLIKNTTIVVNGTRTQADSFTRVTKKLDAELPTGQWNRVEIIADKGKVTYMVNGKIVNEGESPSVSEGKILIQSEGAEIYYRKVDIAKL